MKYLFPYTLFFLSHIVNLCGQDTAIIDSLTLVIANSSRAIEKIAPLNELAFELRYLDSKKAYEYSQQAYQLASKYQNKKEMAYSLVMFGLMAKKEGNYSLAQEHYLEALKLRQELQDSVGIASVFNNLGNIARRRSESQLAISYFHNGVRVLSSKKRNRLFRILQLHLIEVYHQQGQFNMAIVQLKELIEQLRKQNDKESLANALISLGNIHLDTNNTIKARESYEESLNIFKVIGNKNGEAKCYINIGTVSHDSGNYRVALSHYTIALGLKQYLSTEEVALIYKNIGSCHINMANYSRAIPAFQVSLDTNLKLNNYREVASCCHNLGKAYYQKADFSKALYYYQNSLSILDSLPDLFLKSQLLFNLSETYAQLNQHDSAYQMSNQFMRLQDSLNRVHLEATNQLNYLNEKQNKILLLEKEQTIVEAQNREKNLIIIALIISIILMIGLALLGFRVYVNRQKRQLAEKNALITKQRIIELLNDQELKASYARLEGQDNERKRIGQDLHDRMGSMLSTIKLYFNNLYQEISKSNLSSKNYEKANELLDNACIEIRKIAHNLESGILTEFGLEEELKSLTKTLQNSEQLQVQLNTHGFKERLDSILEIKIYRIIQELVNNVLKHANASQLNIQLNRFKEMLNIIIEDDGKGFVVDQAKEKNGMGLRNVKSRLNDLNGTLIIDSNKGNGTTISIDIPLD